MKKIFTIILTLTLIVGISACSNNESTTIEEKKNDSDTEHNEDANNTENQEDDSEDNAESKDSQEADAENMSEKIKSKTDSEIKEELSKIEMDGNENLAVTKLSLEILKNAISKNEDKNQNTMISAISIMSALGMCENGANGETLTQMENTLHLRLDKTNKYFKLYNDNLLKEENQKAFIANSIWIKNDDKLEVKDEFLQTNKDYYNSEVYKADFNDQTVKDINNWVSKNTKGMIKRVISEIPEDAIMYLINAVYFIAAWEEQYTKNDVRDWTFTNEDGEKNDIKIMKSEEYNYLENDNTKGVVKFYKDRKYGFVALLPNEGISIKEYLENLKAEDIQKLIENRQETAVNTFIPKFKAKYETLLNENLKSLGMKLPFDKDYADFKKMALYNNGYNNIYINKVIHKTYIEVDEKGTKAAAVTVVEMAKCECIMETKELILDRPFVYMIYDFENEIPVFMGTVMDLK